MITRRNGRLCILLTIDTQRDTQILYQIGGRQGKQLWQGVQEEGLNNHCRLLFGLFPQKSIRWPASHRAIVVTSTTLATSGKHKSNLFIVSVKCVLSSHDA